MITNKGVIPIVFPPCSIYSVTDPVCTLAGILKHDAHVCDIPGATPLNDLNSIVFSQRWLLIQNTNDLYTRLVFANLNIFSFYIPKMLMQIQKTNMKRCCKFWPLFVCNTCVGRSKGVIDMECGKVCCICAVISCMNWVIRFSFWERKLDFKVKLIIMCLGDLTLSAAIELWILPSFYWTLNQNLHIKLPHELYTCTPPHTHTHTQMLPTNIHSNCKNTFTSLPSLKRTNCREWFLSWIDPGFVCLLVVTI